jgi:hypothetical protein
MQSSGSINASPNPIILSEMSVNNLGTPTGTASISWSAEGVDEVEVRVGSPAGPLFSRTGPGHHEKAASWIVDKTVFCLQDVSGSKPLSADHTLANVEVAIRISPELLRRHRRRLERNLVLLYDAMQDGPLAGRYWVIGGLLIGWAREGRILSHDLQDGDFGFFREDREKFIASIPRIIDAGFKPLYRYCNNNGEPAAYVFEKDWATFDFLEHARVGSAVRFWNFGARLEGNETVRIETVSQVPAFDLAPLEFLGRTWRKPADHDAYLRAIYGNWTEFDPDFDCIKDDASIIDIHPWTGSSDWPGESGALP